MGVASQQSVRSGISVDRDRPGRETDILESRPTSLPNDDQHNRRTIIRPRHILSRPCARGPLTEFFARQAARHRRVSRGCGIVPVGIEPANKNEPRIAKNGVLLKADGTSNVLRSKRGLRCRGPSFCSLQIVNFLPGAEKFAMQGFPNSYNRDSVYGDTGRFSPLKPAFVFSILPGVFNVSKAFGVSALWFHTS